MRYCKSLLVILTGCKFFCILDMSIGSRCMRKEKMKKNKALTLYGQCRREKEDQLQLSFPGSRTEPVVGDADLGESTLSTRVETFSECLRRHRLTTTSDRHRKKRKHRCGKGNEPLFGVGGDGGTAINLDNPVEDLDARITRLEAELEEENESFTSGGDNDDCQTGEKLTSSILVDPTNRIAPLPTSLLPEASCGLSSSSVKQRKKSKRGDNVGRKKLKGLEVSVQELLSSYKPRSGERIPFWCRYCQFEGSSVEDLRQHRETEFHKVVVNFLHFV